LSERKKKSDARPQRRKKRIDQVASVRFELRRGRSRKDNHPRWGCHLPSTHQEPARGEKRRVENSGAEEENWFCHGGDAAA